MDFRRATILIGHYGSGKTSLAVNLALRLRAAGKAVTVADLDIVNPYFRTTDHRAALEEKGVRLIGSRFANSNLDLPSLPGALYAAVEDEEAYVVLDVGGDDRGAVALARFAPELVARGDYEALFVVNFYRPLTRTPEEALAVLREVEAASGLPCTGLVNNSNLGKLTAARDVVITDARVRELSALCGLPVAFTAADRRLRGELEGLSGELFPLDLLQFEPYHKDGRRNGEADV